MSLLALAIVLTASTSSRATQVPDITLNTGAPDASSKVSVTANLTSNGNTVGGTQNTILFDNTILSMSASPSGSALGCKINTAIGLAPNGLDCSADATVGPCKNLLAGLHQCGTSPEPIGCPADAGSSISAINLVLAATAVPNVNPIPDGVLYTCTFTLTNAAAWPTTLSNVRLVASDPFGAQLCAFTAVPCGGSTETTPTPTSTTAATPSATVTSSPPTPTVAPPATPSSTATSPPTPTVVPPETPSATATPSASTPTAAPPATPSATATPSAPIPTTTPSALPSSTATSSASTPTVAFSATSSPTPTSTSPGNLPTHTPEASPTDTAAPPAPTDTPVPTPTSETPLPPPATNTVTATATGTATAVPATATATGTGIATATGSATTTATGTATATATSIPATGTATASVATHLAASIGANDTTIPVDDTSGFPASGTVRVDSELITYTGKTSTALTGVTRGVDGTTPAAHQQGVTVALADVPGTSGGGGGGCQMDGGSGGRSWLLLGIAVLLLLRVRRPRGPGIRAFPPDTPCGTQAEEM